MTCLNILYHVYALASTTQRQAETFGGGRESDEAMGAMRILRGMILARRRKGE